MVKVISKCSGGSWMVRLVNGDGKEWLMPLRGLRMGLELYQPSGRKGKLLKKYLPLAWWLPLFKKERCALRADIADVFKQIFPDSSNDIRFSIFGGTPSVHQKITMQIFTKRKILGYAKYAETSAISELFYRETAILNDLHQKGVRNIPKPLYCDMPPQGAFLFVQDTCKTLHCSSPGEWSDLHENFLRDLANKTSQKMAFRNTDYFRQLATLLTNVNRLPENYRKDIEPILRSHMSKLRESGEGEYSVYHADFTPWNMFIRPDNGELYVFDWEYAGESYPPMLDKYHFHVQQALLVDFLEPEKIGEIISNEEWFDRELCIGYLLVMISMYFNREKYRVSEDFLAWLDLRYRILMSI